MTPPAAARSADREGSWEATFGINVQSSAEAACEGGTTADLDSDLSLRFGASYHCTDNLELTTLMFNATWNVVSGPFSPFVTGAIGWRFGRRSCAIVHAPRSR